MHAVRVPRYIRRVLSTVVHVLAVQQHQRPRLDLHWHKLTQVILLGWPVVLDPAACVDEPAGVAGSRAGVAAVVDGEVRQLGSTMHGGVGGR